MKTLHEKLCTWVQVRHLYQSKRNGLLDAYISHHIARCRFCQSEIESIGVIGTSIGQMDFDLSFSPDDTSWARLSANLPSRTSDELPAHELNASRRRSSIVRIAGLSAVAFAVVGFAAVYQRLNPKLDVVTGPKVILQPRQQGASPMTETANADALEFTRKQATAVVSIDDTRSDPFSKGDVVETDSHAALPEISSSNKIDQPDQRNRKPLIVASNHLMNIASDTSSTDLAESLPMPSAAQPMMAPKMVMRSNALNVQSDSLADSNIASQRASDAVPVSYSPSAAMELTESQNRLRGLLQ